MRYLWIIAFLVVCITPSESVVSVTVSGVSSGAAIALQYSIAHSASVAGSAIIAGVPYYCARDSSIDALSECVLNPELVSIAQLEKDTVAFSHSGVIDEIGNLTNHALYLFSGLLDTVVSQGIMRLVEQMARDLGVTKIESQYDILAEHCVPTDDWGYLCTVLASPFINNCEYDAAGRAFEHLYGKLNAPVTPIDGNIITLDQQKFIPGQAAPSSISMDQNAYVYVPTGCQQSTTNCKLHVSFHGCLQGVEEVGETYVLHGGWNKWAEANNIIVIYPQAIISILDPINPEGCWDWWGYTNADYATKNGVQVATVHNMISSFL